MHLQKTLAVSILAAWAMMASPMASAESVAPAELAAGKVMVRQAEASGTIEAIDAANRVVTLRGPQGRLLDIPAGSEVRNFDQLKVGDMVRISYRSALALALKKGGDSVRKDVETTMAAVPTEGGKPSVAEMRRRTLVSNVVALDRASGVVTLEGPHGRTLDVTVTDPKLLSEIEPGNQVVAVITESAAIAIEPAQ